MSNGNQQAPSSATSSTWGATSNKPQVSSASQGIGHWPPIMTAHYISMGLTPVERLLKFAPRKLISSDGLRFSQMDTWAILNAAARFKNEKFMLLELQKLAAQYGEDSDSPSLVVLIDRRGRPAVPETSLDLFRKALTPGKTIHGKKKMRVDVLVPESIWEKFLIKAMGWWIESGRAPEKFAEMQLELDLGL